MSIQTIGIKAATVPNAPLNLVNVFASTTTITISWIQPSYNGGSSILGYNVYISINSNSSYFLYESSTIMNITVNSVTRG